MNIYLDNVIYTKTKNGGVSNYWFELTKYLLEQKDSETFFFEDKNANLNFHRKFLDISSDKIIETNGESVFSRLLPIHHNVNDKIIYHSSYYRKLNGAKNQLEITTVYDFIHDYFASYINKKLHNVLKYNAIKRSKGVICISKNTYDDLKKFCPLKSNQKAEVIHVGVSDDYFPISKESKESAEVLSKYKLDDEFLLYIGGRTNYKNFDFVTKIVNENKSLKLVIVGGGILSKEEISQFTPEAMQRVIYIGSAFNNELNVFLNNAKALLYPSSYEGFGIPVVEAMRAGCPVIGLNNATINEVASKSALVINELSLHEVANHLKNLENTDFKRQIIESGFEESKKYSWQKCSQETYEFYKEIDRSSW